MGGSRVYGLVLVDDGLAGVQTIGITVTLDESSFWAIGGLGIEQHICIARHSIEWNDMIEIHQTETFGRRPPPAADSSSISLLFLLSPASPRASSA